MPTPLTFTITPQSHPDEWDRAWSLLAQLNGGDPLCECRETGDTWDYVCTSHTADGWFHLFKHPWHPATRQPQSLLIPAHVESELAEGAPEAGEAQAEEQHTIRFTIDLEPELHQRLTEAAERMGRHKSDLVRWAIVQLVKDLKDDVVVG